MKKTRKQKLRDEIEKLNKQLKKRYNFVRCDIVEKNLERCEGLAEFHIITENNKFKVSYCPTHKNHIKDLKEQELINDTDKLIEGYIAKKKDIEIILLEKNKAELLGITQTEKKIKKFMMVVHTLAYEDVTLEGACNRNKVFLSEFESWMWEVLE